MLTRLKVNNFKNLVDVDIHFGPFTCIAGVNGVGKSNLFDAITFLSALAHQPLLDAALSVRDELGKTGDVRSLFHHVGDEYATEMSFEVEMIIPPEGLDDLGQVAQASTTFLHYTLVLTYRQNSNAISLRDPGRALEIIKEELNYINIGDAKNHLPFPHSLQWRKSAVSGRRFAAFISTEDDGINRNIKLHQDGGSSGRPRTLLATALPRTVISTTNAAESPTALLARKEMQSWRLLQLEPSALRTPDPFTAPAHLGADGLHLPATLYRLAGLRQSEQVYAQVANRLARLIHDVSELTVDRDERRELLTLMMTDRYGTPYAARALSDGTLRFLALAVLEHDPEAQGLLCFEEPENGIHPDRIPAMLELLQDLAVDVDEPVDSTNPLRQIIINTHSPAVVSLVVDDSLLIVELTETLVDKKRFNRAAFRWLPDTWRAKAEPMTRPVTRGILLSYLNPISPQSDENHVKETTNGKPRRVIDRTDLWQPQLFSVENL